MWQLTQHFNIISFISCISENLDDVVSLKSEHGVLYVNFSGKHSHKDFLSIHPGEFQWNTALMTSPMKHA